MLEADFIREVYYPKDSYLFPRIDLLVDFTVGHQLLSFMDTFF